MAPGTALGAGTAWPGGWSDTATRSTPCGCAATTGRRAGSGTASTTTSRDVHEAAARFPKPPVLVGHSLGGLIVQRYLEHGPARGAVLLAPLPRRGTAAVVARLAVRHPAAMLATNLSLRLRPFVATPALVRELFFTPDTPQELVNDTFGRLQDESWPAFLDTLVVWPRPRRVQVPILVTGAEHDGFFTVGELRRSAAAYRTEAEIVAGMGHDLMLDQGWPQVADRIDTWVRETATRGRLTSPP